MLCTLCPRECMADRRKTKGLCMADDKIKVAKVMLHFWEEPCISGENGSGAVFFSGCPLKCVMCQNKDISRNASGEEADMKRLLEIFFSLEEKGAENINLVTPTHYADRLIPALSEAKRQGLKIPVIYNSGGYEKVETLKSLEGLIDIYMPDFKYFERETALRYSKAADYPDIARSALDEMTRQIPQTEFDGRGMMKRGVLIRHLLLPGRVEEAKNIMKYLFKRYGYMVWFSLMSQYTPPKELLGYPELLRRITKDEYDEFVDFCAELGMENAFIQELSSASEEFIPDF